MKGGRLVGWLSCRSIQDKTNNSWKLNKEGSFSILHPMPLIIASLRFFTYYHLIRATAK